MIPAHWRRPLASPFPNTAQLQVLTVIFAEPDQAQKAYCAWRDALDLEGPFDAEVFRLLPPLYLRARELGIDDDLMPRLKGVSRYTWLRNLTLLQQAKPAIAALEQAGVPTLVLKGVPLALVTYGSAVARPIADVDVAVPKERLAESIRVLEAAGWTSPKISFGAASVSHAAAYRNERGGEFDLHWHILQETAGSSIETRFWETARPFDLEGIATRMLDPAFALMHTLLHGLRANPVPPVRWVADALTIIRNTADLNWELLVATARAAWVTQRVRLGLAYIAERFAAPVPKESLAALDASSPGIVERAETMAVLFETRGLLGNAITKPVILLADYIRQAEERGLRRIPGFVQYARRRLSMTSTVGA